MESRRNLLSQGPLTKRRAPIRRTVPTFKPQLWSNADHRPAVGDKPSLWHGASSYKNSGGSFQPLWRHENGYPPLDGLWPNQATPSGMILDSNITTRNTEKSEIEAGSSLLDRYSSQANFRNRMPTSRSMRKPPHLATSGKTQNGNNT